MAAEASSEEDQLWASRSNFEDIFTLVAVGDLKGVKEVVEKDREKLKATEDGEGATPLHWAVRHNREDVVKMLVMLMMMMMTPERRANQDQAHRAESRGGADSAQGKE